MNLIWDILLKAERQGFPIERSDIFFKQAESYSPYYEQAFSLINQREVDSLEVEINALYRFNKIFEDMLHPEFCREASSMGVFWTYFFDVFIHFLAEIDLRHGLTKREYYIRQIRLDMLAGSFGEETMRAIRSMDRETQFVMAEAVLRHMQTGGGLYLFRRIIRTVFSDSIVYQSNFNSQHVYIYLPQAKTEALETVFNFIHDAFLPFGFVVKAFWEYHFGIIGVEETMKIDEIAIF